METNRLAGLGAETQNARTKALQEKAKKKAEEAERIRQQARAEGRVPRRWGESSSRRVLKVRRISK